MEPTKSLLDLGIVGLALLVAYKGLDILGSVLLSKKAAATAAAMPSTTVPPHMMTPLACQSDPQHFERIRETHNLVQQQAAQLANGKLGCAWKGRDEVRDMLESMRALTTAVGALAEEMREQRR